MSGQQRLGAAVADLDRGLVEAYHDPAADRRGPRGIVAVIHAHGGVVADGAHELGEVTEGGRCQRRTESPQKWRRKIPQLAGWRLAVDVISTSVFWWPAPAFQGRGNGVRGCLRFVSDRLGDEISMFA